MAVASSTASSKREAARRERPLPRYLEQSIKDTPEDIEREKNRGLGEIRKRVRAGRTPLPSLPSSRSPYKSMPASSRSCVPPMMRDTNFTALINDADMGRDSTLRALIELQQRLLQAAPIPQAPTSHVAQRQWLGSDGGAQVGMAQVVTLPSDHSPKPQPAGQHAVI